MNKFLSKFLSEDEVAKVVEAYKVKHPDAPDLPEYVSMKRFSEVLTERDNKQVLLDGIPGDWKTQIETATKNYETEKAAHVSTKKEMETHKVKVATLEKDNTTNEILYKARAKNIKAVKALMDPEKAVEEEVTRLQKEEGYLFGETKPPKGTGKAGEGDPGNKEVLSNNSMREALGLAPETTK